MYQLRKTLFAKLHSFNILFFDDQKFFKNMPIVDFDSICEQEDKFRDTDTTTRIGKHDPISVSLSTDLIGQRIFSCNSNLGVLVQSFADAFEGFLTRNKAQIKWKLRLVWKVNSITITPLLMNVAVARHQYCNFKMSVLAKKKSKMSRHSYYKHKRIYSFICKINWKYIAKSFQSLASTVQNTTLI